MADRGRLGGLETLKRHGSFHMRVIGRAGYEVTLERHFAGDAQAMHSHLLKLRHAPKVWCERSQCWKQAA